MKLALVAPAKRLRTLALACAPLLAVTPALSQTASVLLSATGQVSGVVVSPPTMYGIATSPLIWNGLMKSIAPYLMPYSETLRQLALNKAPRLTPVASAPHPPAQVFGNVYSQLVSFGDSMSDTGNMYAVTLKLGGTGLPTAPNGQGRFSNGPVVLEAMANALNRPLLNYAFGGARSGSTNLIPAYGMQQGMLKQIGDFLANQRTIWTPVDADALYVLWTGPDDFYSDGNIFNPLTVPVVTANIRQGMVQLYQRGARQFFVPLMPDLAITPSAHEHNKTLPTYQASAHARSAELAQAVTAMLQAFAKQYPQAKVRTFDTYTYSQTRVAQAAAEGYNVTEPCYTPAFMGLPGPVCDHPDQYLFWDTNHPTAAGSLVIGTAFAEAAAGDALPSK